MTEVFRDQESPTMFPNRQLPPQSAVNHQVTTTISEEADSKKESNITSGNEGVSVEVTRRPRGRPPGSKNRRKSPVLVTQKPDPSMSPYVLEVAGGSDIVTAVTRFCNHHNTCLCVLSGSGTVSNVSVRQPTTTTAATIYGRFDLLSISATILPPSSSSSVVLTPFTNNDFVGKFVVSLAGQKGQIFGGAVVGPLIAAGTVHIVAASFNNPLYHRLPMEEDDHVRNSGGGSARDQSQGSSGGDSIRHHAPPSTAPESLSMYSHLPNADVIWTPVPRQAQPHSSFY